MALMHVSKLYLTIVFSTYICASMFMLLKVFASCEGLLP